MAILTSLRGKVEADPLRIPAPARASSGGGESFAAVLEQAVQDDAPPAPEPTPPADAAAAPASDEPDPDAAALPPAPPADDEELPAADRTAATTLAAAPTAAAEDADHLRRPEPAGSTPAGRGQDPAHATRPGTANAETLLVAVVQHGAQTRGPAIALPPAGVAAVGAARAGEAPTRAFDAGLARPTPPVRAAAVAAGYRTDAAGGAALLEQARDSVFKQILLQLHADGGEMRLRLEPPDLGELDLRLVVTNGNQLSLTIAAERADLTLLLQKHLDELKQTLQASGLEVTDAHVHQRDAGAARDEGAFRPAGRGRADADDDAVTAPATALRRGYVTAEGLDFWA